LVAAKVAELRGETVDAVLKTTAQNARAFFNLPEAEK
jgi:Tat protein secretion system quality control protein TatD with DNase activity